MTHLLYKPLLGVVLSIWSALSGPSSTIIPSAETCIQAPGRNEICACADGAVRAVIADEESAPVYSSHDEDLAVMAYFIYRESSMKLHAVGDGGRSHGMLQMRNSEAFKDAFAQAAQWLKLLHDAKDGEHACPVSPIRMMWGSCADRVPDGRGGWIDVAKLARQRERAARRLLMKTLLLSPAPTDKGVAEPQKIE